MKRYASFFLVVSALLFASQGMAYEVDTHEKLSATAAKSSILSSDTNVVENLGLSPSIEDNNNLFPNSEGKPRNILNLIKDGANFEDTLSFDRPMNHFYNPLTGAPLTALGIELGSPSPDWALEDKGQINGTLGFRKQNFSYQDARQYFYDALTQSDKTKREENFGKTFQTMGHIIHHVQDMAQPEHVRNDQHLDLGFSIGQTTGLCLISPLVCAGYLAIKNPSLYESYTNRPDVRAKLPIDFTLAGYDISDPKFASTFNIPRNLWHTNDGKGLADFTNRGFVSAGTIFDSAFPSPVLDLSKKLDFDIQQLIPGTSLRGNVRFYGNTVTDNFTGASVNNPMAVTRSIFDAELEKYATFGKKAVYTLNRFNFDVAHSFLIPRAVGYSAGLINYFFRGKIDFIDDTNNAGKYVIKNLGPEAMTGDFTLYYDAVDGKRYPIAGDGPDKTWAGRTIAKGGQLDNLSFASPTNPAATYPGEYMLVFNGDMGEEKASAGVTVGAVVAKLIKGEPDLKMHSYLGSGVISFNPNGAVSSGISAGQYQYGKYFRGISVYEGDVFLVKYDYTSSVSDVVLRNNVAFTEGLEIYDTAASSAGVFVPVVLGAGGQSAQLEVFDLQGNAIRSLTINPSYNLFGGQVEIAANATHIATTNNEHLYIYTVNGDNVATISGLDVFSQRVAMTRDRVFYVDNTKLKTFDLTGAQQKLFDLTSVINGPLACIAATEKRFYVVTFSNGIYYLHIFTRTVSRDKDGNILSDDFAFFKSINLSAHIQNVGTCTVDSAYMNRVQLP